MDESPVSSSREKVLRLREQQEVLELFDEGAVIVDREGGIFFANRAARIFLGVEETGDLSGFRVNFSGDERGFRDRLVKFHQNGGNGRSVYCDGAVLSGKNGEKIGSVLRFRGTG